jgi:hypothetical protein
MQQNSGSGYESVEQLKKLFSEGYSVRRISYPPTSDGVLSIMIDLLRPNRLEECLLTVFGDEALILSEFVKSSSKEKQKGEIDKNNTC